MEKDARSAKYKWFVHARRSQPIHAVVPHALPERVYDIKYFVRDSRREHMLVGGTNKKHDVHSKLDPKAEDNKLSVEVRSLHFHLACTQCRGY